MRSRMETGVHMRIAWLASFVHKWLALIIGVQILVWIGTGLFFTLYPIEQVRSENRVRELTPIELADPDAAAVATIVRSTPHPTRLTIESRPEGSRIVAEYPDRTTALFDGRTGERLSPLNAETALSVARTRINTSATVRTETLVAAETTEYRGPLPAWRIEFNEPEKLAVYVSANTGLVTARRSELWRIYDTLWAMHIMDYRDHENFNHLPIIIVSVLALISTLGGIALIPYRFKWRRRRAPTTTSPSG